MIVLRYDRGTYTAERRGPGGRQLLAEVTSVVALKAVCRLFDLCGAADVDVLEDGHVAELQYILRSQTRAHFETG